MPRESLVTVFPAQRIPRALVNLFPSEAEKHQEDFFRRSLPKSNVKCAPPLQAGSSVWVVQPRTTRTKSILQKCKGNVISTMPTKNITTPIFARGNDGNQTVQPSHRRHLIFETTTTTRQCFCSQPTLPCWSSRKQMSCSII